MKKTTLLITTVLTILSFNANAAILESSYISGAKKICIYSDGSTVQISSGGVCRPTKA